jgi:hypothetical protein
MLKILYRPWLHFLVLGAVLFLFLRWLNPPPRPTVGPLPQARIDNLQREWFSTTGRPPSEAQLARMVEAELDREILFQEALELDIHLFDPVVRQRLVRNMHFLQLAGERDDEALYQDALRMQLHLGDEVVKRRLIQVMEQLLLSRQPPQPVTEADIAQRFAEGREELRRPERYTIDQIYLPRERASEVETVAAEIRQRELDPDTARKFSSPFLPGYRFVAQSPAQLARNFGAAFVMNFQQLNPVSGTWLGPVESTYGFHLVWIESIEAARDARLDEVRDQLQRDLAIERRREALHSAVAQQRADYEVIL